MRSISRPKLRKHWLSLCATTLVLYVAFLVRYAALYDLGALGARLEVLMFLLSFPLGSLFMFFFYTGVGGVAERVLLWPMALAIGYIQWFHLVPALLSRRRARVTTLNLSHGAEVASAPAAQPSNTSLPTDKKLLTERNTPPVPQFDDRGLTPLGRILDEK